MPDIVHIPLTPIDHLPPPVPQQCVLYFGVRPGVSNHDVFAHLQKGLYLTLKQVPWLGGKVYPRSREDSHEHSGLLEIRYDSHADARRCPEDCSQIRWKELHLTTSFEELALTGFPVNAFEDEDVTWLARKPGDPVITHGEDVVSVQVNFIPGACLIVPSVNHAACDGMGMAIFLRLWGEQCRFLSMEAQGQQAIAPSLSACAWDRKQLEHIWAKEATGHAIEQLDPIVWRMIGLDPPQPGHDALMPPRRHRIAPRLQSMSSRIFYLPASSLKELQGSRDVSAVGTAECSGNDLIVALMWRMLIRTRLAARRQRKEAFDVAMETSFELHVVTDVRDRFSDTLPQIYMGNCIFHHRPTLSHADLVGPNSNISSVAHAVYMSGNELTHERIMDAYMLLKHIRNWARLHPMRHLTMDDAWTMTSLIMFPEDDVNFGDLSFANGGKPCEARLLMGNRNRAQIPGCYILPRKTHGGVELLINVFEDEWPLVMEDEEFSRFTSRLS